MADQDLQIKITTTADASGAKQAEEALKGVNTAAKATSESADHLHKNIGTLRNAFTGLRQIIGGALTGNLNEVAHGFGRLSSAISGASAGMKAFFSELAVGASAAAVVAGPILVLLAAMKQKVNENARDMKRWWEEAAKHSEAYKAKQAEVRAAAEADLKVMIADVEKLASAWDDTVAAMNKAEKRMNEINAAQKELELAKAAGDPSKTAAVEAKFGAIDLENQGLNAKTRKSNAEQTIVQARQNVDDAQARVREARASGNRTAIDAAEANLAEVQGKSGATIKSAYDEIEAADTSSTVTGIKRQTLTLSTATKAAGINAASGDRLQQLRGIADSANARGDQVALSEAQAEYKKLNDSIRNFAKNVADTGATTADAIKRADQKLKLLKQAGPGGGG